MSVHQERQLKCQLRAQEKIFLRMEHVLFLFQRSSASGQGVGAGQNFSNWESGRKREEALLSRLSRIIRIVT